MVPMFNFLRNITFLEKIFNRRASLILESAKMKIKNDLLISISNLFLEYLQ